MLLGRNWMKDMTLEWKSFGIWKVGSDDQRLVKGCLKQTCVLLGSSKPSCR